MDGVTPPPVVPNVIMPKRFHHGGIMPPICRHVAVREVFVGKRSIAKIRLKQTARNTQTQALKKQSKLRSEFKSKFKPGPVLSDQIPSSDNVGEDDPIPAMEPTGERVKTSVLLDHTILARAKKQARIMGLSFNAFVTVALYEKLQGRAIEGPARYRSGRVISQPFNPHTTEPGRGFTLPGDGEHPACFVAWPDVARYAEEQARDLEADFMTIGKKLRLSMDEARAADIAQGTPEFQAYMEATHGHRA